MYDGFVEKLLEIGDRVRPNRALRLAILGPAGSGKIELSKCIESHLRDHPARVGKHLHVRFDSAVCDGFQFDDAHARIISAIQGLLGTDPSPGKLPDTKDATINFVSNVRSILSGIDGHLFLYLDHLEMIPGNLVRSLGNSFRELIESEGADETPDRFHLVWSGNISIFEIRSIENSALAMCEVIALPMLEPEVREAATRAACEELGLNNVGEEVIEELIVAAGGEPGFLNLLLREIKTVTLRNIATVEDVRQASGNIVNYGWRLTELSRLGKLLLSDETLWQLGCQLADDEPVYC
jgi:hypothetical protein